jgi:hypothetical protein
LIGVDRYLSEQLRTLQGCVNDVERMKEALIARLALPKESIKTLKNDEATRDGILGAIRTHLLEPAAAGDVVILHFSGHGAQSVDDSGEEPDGLDETIVPHDSRVGQVFDITDDEINELLSEIAARTPNVVFILDSCHSGAAAKAAGLGTSVRQAPVDLRRRPRAQARARGLIEGPGGVRPLGANYVLISGSMPHELSNEALFGERFDGALTHALTEVLKTAPPRATYRDVMDAVRAHVSARFPYQHPQIEGTGLDSVVFGTEQLTARPFVLVEPKPEGGKLAVEAGEIHGLTRGTVLRVYAAGTKDFEAAPVTARARITAVEAFTAEAEVEGAGRVGDHSRAVLEAVRSPGFQAGVLFEGVDGSPLLKEVRQGLSAYDLVRSVTAPTEALLRLRVSEGQAQLLDRDGGLLSSVPDGAASAGQVASRVLHWAQWHALLALEGKSTRLDVELRLERPGLGGAWEPVGEEVSEGTPLRITATNRSSTPLFLLLLDLTSDGAVKPLRPRPGQAPEAVSPGKSITLEPTAGLKPGAERVVDVLKVIATTKQVSPDSFVLGAAQRNAPLGGAGEDALARFIRLTVQGRARDMLEPVQVDDWMTRQRSLRVVRPAARATGFAAHFGSAMDPGAVRDALSSGKRSVCTGPDRASCYDVKASGVDASILEVVPPTQRDAGAPPPSIGRAFEEAYQLMGETHALRVEPLFEVELPIAARPPEARGSLLPSDAHDARAQADPMWSLKHVRVPDAWAVLAALPGHSAGAEAAGVVIAHPDTGFRPHPEIWDAIADRRPIWAEKGHDYVDDDADATDPLLNDGLLDNPGHGTGSASAIVSPPGCQLGGATQCPTGVARGARLVPLRVHKSVVHFDTRQLSRAITDASGDDRTRVGEKTSVMSISMGGVPSWTLWRAVTNAERRGYLIVAAAGNYVHTVVWPARFDSTIAVAATNVGCRPWAHTSAGPAVDISAPGDSVWRGLVDSRGTFSTGMGSGTTFATATVAGVAALWMARHEGTPELQALRSQGRVTEVFRQQLQATAWKPGPSAPAGVACDGGSWNAQLMGAGIVDAAGLLARALPTAAPRSTSQPATLESLPLFVTLYSASTRLDAVWADYRRLFTPGSDDRALGAYEAEVMFHYAQGRDVAAALDRVAQAGDRSDDAFRQASEALRSADLSDGLRGALRR